MKFNRHSETIRTNRIDVTYAIPLDEFILYGEPGLGDEHLYFDLP